jgi:RNA polymerase sigma-70 factor (ECF subfamily)
MEEKNRDKFAGLYEQYVEKIYRFIYYKTHHKETAEDLTSTTFLKALDNFESFSGEKGKFSTWLYQIARNTVIDFYRAKKTDVSIEDAWGLSGKENIERDIDTLKKLENVKEYLKKLDPEQREIVLLRVWEGMSHKEIAEIMGKTEGSCKVMFSRTINALRQEMPLGLFLYFISSKL